jgi:hypothetical protein
MTDEIFKTQVSLETNEKKLSTFYISHSISNQINGFPISIEEDPTMSKLNTKSRLLYKIKYCYQLHSLLLHRFQTFQAEGIRSDQKSLLSISNIPRKPISVRKQTLAGV